MVHSCRTCGGKGWVPCIRCGGCGYFGWGFHKETCSRCNGEKIIDCPACDRTGEVED